MPDRRFEDNVTIKEVLSENSQKELMAKIYIQTLKTNGQVRETCKDVEKLQKQMNEKIGWKIFTAISAILAAIIVLFNVLNIVAGM
jgi:predicted transcriptional regulator